MSYVAVYCLDSYKCFTAVLKSCSEMSSSLVHCVYLRTACYFVWLIMWLKRRVGVPCLHCNSVGKNDKQEGSHSVVTG